MDELLGYFEIGEEELVGDELVGDEAVEALLGAVARRRAPGRRALPARRNPAAAAAAQILAAKRAANSTLVRERPFTKSREWPIGFNSSADVAAGATATITQRPQVPFRGERLIIPTPVAVTFDIIDIRVGKDSQLLASGSIPGIAFVENAQGVRLHLDTCNVGMDLTLTVQNKSTTTPASFQAALIGRAVE